VPLDPPRPLTDRAAATPGERTAGRHVPQIDVVRIVPMVGVVAAHTVVFTQPVASVGAAATLMLLHANRGLFFFVTGFLLVRSSTGSRPRTGSPGRRPPRSTCSGPTWHWAGSTCTSSW